MISTLTALVLLPATPLSNGADEQATWLELDREIASIANAPLLDDGGPTISFDMILSAQTSDDAFYAVGAENRSGFSLRRVRATAKGEVAGYSYKISGDLKSGTMELKDAYVGWQCGEMFDLTIGRYKNPLLWSGTVSSFADPFHDVQVTGKENSGRAPGIKVATTVGDFDLLLSMQNGADGLADESLIVGRLQWNLLGQNAFGKWHGSYGYSEETQLSAAFGFLDDGAIDNGSATSGEVGLVMNAFSVRADMVAYDEDYDATTGIDPDSVLGSLKTDTTPSSFTLGYLFGGNEWEFLIRQEEFDDILSTDRSSVGIVKYSDRGPKSRWALLYQEMSSDLPALEGTRLELSFAMGSN